MNDGFLADGEVSLIGAHIGGTLNCDEATFINEDGAALNADLIVVDQSMWIGRTTITGGLILLGADISGSLSCGGSIFSSHTAHAFHGDGLHVGRDLICDSGFTATGEIRLAGARVGGQLNVSGATLTNDSGPVLTADGLRVDQHVSLKELSGVAGGESGAVRLSGAHVGGWLDAVGARLTNRSGAGLIADGLSVDQQVHWHNLTVTGVSEAGAVRLWNAHIGGPLNVLGATLTNTPVQDLCDHFQLLAEQELPTGLLTGLYLHGGVVFGEWAPRESDVDFLATLATGRCRRRWRRCGASTRRWWRTPRSGSTGRTCSLLTWRATRARCRRRRR
ncbi:hypothetical protein [Kribbella sp. C-35]|uniref:hypothetical protein n=1 Tax=Kribbella sp. C-35 TaxID=2789276 RepID=UPI00397DDB63